METPSYIQRSCFTLSRIGGNGLNVILSFHSDFDGEFLRRSLRYIKPNIEKYHYVDYVFKNKPDKQVTVFCEKDKTVEVIEMIQGLADKKFELKHHSFIHRWVYQFSDIELEELKNEARKIIKPDSIAKEEDKKKAQRFLDLNNKRETDHWWDVCNHWMFWKKSDLFAEKFKQQILWMPSK